MTSPLSTGREHDPADRRFPRYACKFPSFLDVLVPELTFSPRNVGATVVDISRTGCRLTSQRITHDYYRALMQELRHAKIEVDLTDGRILKLKGKLVWVDYSRSITFLGIMFTTMSQDHLDALDALLAGLHQSGMITLAETSRPAIDLSELELD